MFCHLGQGKRLNKVISKSDTETTTSTEEDINTSIKMAENEEEELGKVRG
jgi:hypothetical protein